MKRAIGIIDRYKVCILLVLLLLFAYVRGIPVFRVSSFIRQTTVMVLLTIGVSLEMICGTFDLAFAAQISLSTLAAMACIANGCPVWLGCAVVFAVNGMFGCLKGALLVGLKMPSIITTLALQVILTSLTAGVTENSGIVRRELQFFYQEKMGMACELLFMLAGVAVAFLFLEHTYYGKYCRMLGENLKLAEESGVACLKISMLIHLSASVFLSLSSVLLMLQTGSGGSSLGENYLYRVLTAVFLGDIGLRTGKGKVAGMVIGTVAMVLLNAILTEYGYLNKWEMILEGLAILVVLLAKK